MTVSANLIPAAYIDKMWNLVEHLVSELAIEVPGKFSEEWVLEAARFGDIAFWVGWDTETEKVRVIVGTDITIGLDGKRYGRILFVKGEGREEWQEMITVIEGYFEKMGVDECEFNCRLGWSPLLKRHGYRAHHITMKKELRHG